MHFTLLRNFGHIMADPLEQPHGPQVGKRWPILFLQGSVKNANATSARLHILYTTEP